LAAYLPPQALITGDALYDKITQTSVMSGANICYFVPMNLPDGNAATTAFYDGIQSRHALHLTV